MTKKSDFNVNYSKGFYDGMTKNGFLLAIQYRILKNCRESFKNAPIMVYYEQRYKDYKEGFLKAFWS